MVLAQQDLRILIFLNTVVSVQLDTSKLKTPTETYAAEDGIEGIHQS